MSLVSESRPFSSTEKTLWGLGVVLFAGIMIMFLMAPAWTQNPPVRPKPAVSHMEEMPDMPGMVMDTAPETPEQLRKHAADKRESEFNHHLAGYLVMAAAIFFLLQGNLSKRWPSIRYAWPMCFLIAGFFLLLVSDTEIWPFGYMSFTYAIAHNHEDAQHKTFALILLVLGAVEMLRASGRLRAAWSAWVFPVVGICGTILLLFHEHGGMSGPDAMQTMYQVMHQHWAFAGVGAGVCLTKGLSDTKFSWSSVFAKIWPLFMIALGLLLAFYHE